MISNYGTAHERAIDRDIRDTEKLAAIHTMIGRWLDELAPESSDCEHPDSRWHPEDLLVDLIGHSKNIEGALERLKGPVVLDDEDY